MEMAQVRFVSPAATYTLLTCSMIWLTLCLPVSQGRRGWAGIASSTVHAQCLKHLVSETKRATRPILWQSISPCIHGRMVHINKHLSTLYLQGLLT